MSSACAALFCTLFSVSAAQARGFGGSPVAPLGGGVHRGAAVAGGRFGGRPVAFVQPRPVRVEALRAQHVPLPTDVGFGRALAAAHSFPREPLRVAHVERPGVHVEHPLPLQHVVHRLTPNGHAALLHPGGLIAGHHVARLLPSVAEARAFSVRAGFRHHDLFDNRWSAAHPRAWWPAGWAGRRPWAWTAWPALSAWLGWRAVAQPVYFDYGGNVIYAGDQVYYGGQPVATAVQYYQQALGLAQSLPPPPSVADQWTPLGVFALTEGEPPAGDRVFQLAVSQQGAIGGNFSEMPSEATLPVQGAADQASGRAAWTVGDDRTVVYETGIYNLTQEQTPVLVHFGPTATQQWMLVRLQQ
jgi:hypothetical protein